MILSPTVWNTVNAQDSFNSFPYESSYTIFNEDFKQPGCSYDHSFNCNGFDSWQEVVVSLSNLTSQFFNVAKMQLNPRKKLVLNSELDIQKAFNKNPPSRLNLLFYKLNGVDMLGWMLAERVRNYAIQLHESAIAFYVDGLAPGEYECTEDLLKTNKKNTNTTTFFNFVSTLTIPSSAVFDSYTPVCPFVFTDAKLITMTLEGLVDSFLIKNVLHFSQASSCNKSSINSKIDQVLIRTFNIKLDETFLHPLVFEKVQYLTITISIGSIQSTLFKSLKFLRIIHIQMCSLNNFFHQIGIDWISYLNNKTLVIFSDNLQEITCPYNYSYPNSDLCIFADFPFKNSILPILDASSNLTECTDTMAWLSKTYSFENVMSNKYFTTNAQRVYSTCWENNLSNMTNVQKKINQCKLAQSTGSNNRAEYTLDSDYYEQEFMLELVQNLLAFVFIPAACILGLLLNLRVIWTIRKNEKVELKEDFYNYMSLNSKFNCLYCLIFVFYPINYCLSRVNDGYFCSPIFNTVAAQFYKLVFIAYFGESVKMCSNISYIFISINRYMLIGKEHSSLLEKLTKWKMKRVVLFAVIFSLLINVGHFFQFKINYGWGFLLDASYYGPVPDVYPILTSSNDFLSVYFLVYFLLNFVVFLVFNTAVEVSLVRKMRQEIAEKRKKTEEEIKNTSLKNNAQSQVVNKMLKAKQKKIEQDAKKETRAVVMVILNSLVNFILRLPEIFVTISSYNLSDNLNDNILRSMPYFTIIMVSSSYLAYILTFTTNVSIFYFFNTKFKQVFIFWQSNVKHK
jgi:hypothetical protein